MQGKAIVPAEIVEICLALKAFTAISMKFRFNGSCDLSENIRNMSAKEKSNTSGISGLYVEFAL